MDRCLRARGHTSEARRPQCSRADLLLAGREAPQLDPRHGNGGLRRQSDQTEGVVEELIDDRQAEWRVGVHLGEDVDAEPEVVVRSMLEARAGGEAQVRGAEPGLQGVGFLPLDGGMLVDRVHRPGRGDAQARQPERLLETMDVEHRARERGGALVVQ